VCKRAVWWNAWERCYLLECDNWWLFAMRRTFQVGLQMFKEIESDGVVTVSVLKACVSSRDICEGRLVIRRGFDGVLFVVNSLCWCGRMLALHFSSFQWDVSKEQCLVEFHGCSREVSTLKKKKIIL
jgi:hypothetical protein